MVDLIILNYIEGRYHSFKMQLTKKIVDELSYNIIGCAIEVHRIIET